MAKVDFKPGNMLYPLPVVLVSVADGKGNSDNGITYWAEVDTSSVANG